MAAPVITHRKVSGKAQGPDLTRVYGNHWDDAHVITGLENVDNTSDVNKPVSTAQQAAINSGVASVTKTSIGLGNVDNTSDANKPLSTADTTALALKAPLASPSFTGAVSSAGPVSVTDTTASTSTTTGALKVSGGLGVAGAMNAASAALTSPLPVASGGTNYAGGAWTTYTPTVTGPGGTYTFTGTAAQLTIGKIQYVSIDITVTVASGTPTACQISYPSTQKRSTFLLGRESGITGKMCVWRGADGTAFAYDNSTPAATGSIFNFTGAYEIA